MPDSPGSGSGASGPDSPSSLSGLASPVATGGKAAASPCVAAGDGCGKREESPAAAPTPDRASSGGLIAAFPAGASSDSADQLQGSPVLQRYPASGQAGADQAGQRTVAELAESADLSPGSHLALLLRLPTPGLSFASSAGGGLGPSPLMPTPPPFAAQLSAGERQ